MMMREREQHHAKKTAVGRQGANGVECNHAKVRYNSKGIHV